MVTIKTTEAEFLPLEEVLEELQISERTFRRYCSSGKLARVIHGGRTYVKRQWIEDYWARRGSAAQKNAHSRAKRQRQSA